MKFATLWRTAAMILGLSGPLAAQAAPPAAPPATATPAGTPAPRAIRSWTADARDLSVGDLLTVLIDENTMASARKGDRHSDSRTRDMGLSASGSGIAASLPATGASVGSASDAQSETRGESTRQNRFRTEVTVRVTAVEDGRAKIEGEKSVQVDKDRQELVLSGWIRPEDISARNTVDSWRIAEADIRYRSKGKLGKPKSGIITRILGWFWP